MKVLVTGHLGYIGTVLTPLLAERGHDVFGLDSDLFSRCTFTGEVYQPPLIGKDVRDFNADENAVEKLRGLDAIIHLAALSNDPLGDYRKELTHSINMEASVNLARHAKSAGVEKFLFASSCSNYGVSDSDFISEDGVLNPQTPYGKSKVDVEAAVSGLADEEFSPVFLRASTAYGVSPRMRFDIVVNNLTAWAYTTGKVAMKSDGLPWRPIVHVEDICRAYIAILEAPRSDVHNQSFNVGQTSENYRVKEIAEIVRDVVPNSEVSFASEPSVDNRSYRVDCNHISRTLHHFKPQWTCKRGVEQLLESYSNSKITLEEFEGEKYKRIKHIMKLIREGHLDDNLRVM